MRPYLVTLLFLFLGLHFSASAQQDSVILDNIIGKSKKLSDERPVEKVYIHFDKPFYGVADTIWFKAYVTMDLNLPSQLSKIVYLDVVNNRDSLVQTLKMPIVDGIATGNIPLTKGTYLQGNYSFRAYTLWMSNFDPSYFFSKNIAIGEAIDKQVVTHFSYKTTQSTKSQLIDAVVQFKNNENTAIANKQVTWEVTSNFDVVSKGKGTTDQNGILKIKIDPRKADPITNGELKTSLTLAEDDIQTSIFKLRPAKSAYDVQFFPEGGELIAGIATRIGFKAINSTGLGTDVKGSVTDNSGTPVTTFSSTHLGMGSFYLNADASKTYKVNITFKDGSVKDFELPKIQASGATIQVNNTDPLSVAVKILANEPYFSVNKGKTIFVVGTSGGVICYAAKTKLNNQLTNAKMPKDKFPSGIMQITLFSENGEPIAERLAFNNAPSTATVSLKSDLAAYKPRSKVKLTVTAKDATAALEGSYSISVTDDQKVPVNEDTEITILSSLLLTSDIKGYVEKPNYYFNKPDEKKLADLDVLLLTQGYRRFNYKDLLAGNFSPLKIFPEKDMRLSGTLRDRTGMPVKKGALRLTVTGSRYAAEAVTSPSGTFVFPNLSLPDSSEVLINAKYSANGSSLMILLDGQPGAPLVKDATIVDEITNIDSAMAPYLANSKKQYSYLRTLKEVKIEGAKVKRPSHSDHLSLAGLSNISGRLIEGDRFKGCPNFAICLQGQAPGLTYFENNFYVTRDYQQGSRIPIQIFMNASPIDYSTLTSIVPEDIESVEVFLKDELGTIDRMYGTKGVMVVNTKKPVKGTKITLAELKAMIPQANLAKFKPKGFATQREFYAPKYVNPANTYNFNDLRTTIYWNPKVITGATGPLTLEYYNADGNGTYRAVIEGIDKNGTVSRSVYRYTVK
ncbi:MAG: carboxypeptidase-like regulatory domain-containing protein [Bacteroidota bacterium]